MVLQKQNRGNGWLVMDCIRRSGPISKADIAKQTGLTPPTITNITADLLDIGCICEDRMDKGGFGRPSLLLKVNADMGKIAVLYLRTYFLVACVVNTAHEVEFEQQRDIRGYTSEEVVQFMLEAGKNCLDAAGGKLDGMGIVVRGPVNFEQGISIFAPNTGWRNLPLQYIFEEHFHLPVFLENDAQALALGEYYFGSAKQTDNLLLLKFSQGVGMAFLVNGRLFRGNHESAGEIGHMTIDINGPLCSCGNRGCVEMYASEKALVEEVRSELRAGRESSLREDFDRCLDALEAEDIYEAAVAGDALAVEKLEKNAYYLGIALANIVNLLDPQFVVISSCMGAAAGCMDPVLKKTVAEHSFKNNNALNISYSDQGVPHTIQGMADLVFSHLMRKTWLC